MFKTTIPHLKSHVRFQWFMWIAAAGLAVGRLWIGATFPPTPPSEMGSFTALAHLFIGALIYAGWGPQLRVIECQDTKLHCSHEVQPHRADARFLVVTLSLLELAVFLAPRAAVLGLE